MNNAHGPFDIISGIKVSFESEEFSDIIYDDYVINGTLVLDHAYACKALQLPLGVCIFICIFYLLIFLLAIPGNFVVFCVVGCSRHKLSPSDLFLFHLALADLMLALTLPLSAVSVLQGWVFGNFTCKLVSMAMEVNYYTSILFLVCISADRYIVVVHAATETWGRFRGRWIPSWIACGCVWTLGLLLSVPAVIYNEAFKLDEKDKIQCGEYYTASTSTEWRFATRMLRHLIGFLIPLGAMVGFYGVTIARLVQTRGFRKQKAMRVIILVVVAFLLCWSPYHLAVIVDTLVRDELASSCEKRNEVDLALLVTQSLGLLNCCINPVLYAFVGEKFRSNLKKLLCRRSGLERESMSRFSRSTSSTSQDANNALT
ncbi:C-X-C chemokine receptor type 1-like [Hoplias malabaricus]|uniref:C-X-C chemokine receptor type 1-like n=1 Tax=Hoplias malabaricus TaxID=27720 RepID=UPI003462D6E5